MSSVKWKSLTFEDVEVISIEIHDNTDKNFIFQSLENAQKKVGKTVMVCADDGSDLRGGIDLFCEKYNVGRVFDTIHKIGTFLKSDLEKDPKWEAFISKISEAKKKMQQTNAAHLMPPNLRTKSRFLNIDIVSKWSVDGLMILTTPNHPDKELFEKYCGWLIEYKEFIECLRQLDLVNKHVRQHIRDYGLCSNTGKYIEELLEDAMKSVAFHERACQHAGKLIDFFILHSKIVPQDQVWIGSSEIIESLFGKLKSLEQDQHKGGFTALVLGVSACTGVLDSSVINKALLETKTKDVDNWVKSEIGQTFLSKRRKSLGGWRKKIKEKKRKERCVIKNIEMENSKNAQELTGVHLEELTGI